MKLRDYFLKLKHIRMDLKNSSTSGGFTYNNIFKTCFTQPQANATIGLTAIVVVVGSLGNILTIVSVLSDKRFRAVYNFYLANLATIDLFICGVILPTHSYQITNNVLLSYLFCLGYSAICYSIFLLSVLAMCLISLDRVMVFRDGIQYANRQSHKIVFLKIASTWVFSFGLFSILFAISDSSVKRRPSGSNYDCILAVLGELSLEVSLGISVVLTPAILILGVNSVLCSALIKRSFKSTPGGTLTTTTRVFTVRETRDVVASSSTETSATSVRWKKSATILAAISLLFVICWAPYSIQTLNLCRCASCSQYLLLKLTSLLFTCKSAINPFIYVLISKKYRQKFRSLLLFWRRRKVLPAR